VSLRSLFVLHDLQGCVKKLAKPGQPSDRPLAIVLRALSRAFAFFRFKTVASDGAPSPTAGAAPAVSGTADLSNK
jgi:hypothetical protein